MSFYAATCAIPALVQKAQQLAQESGFKHSCSDEVGRFLQVLAGQYRAGCLAEIGTGCGVGAAWIISALAPTVNFVTVELDEARAKAASYLFADYPNVRVMQGDWHNILSAGPFNFLFADGGKAKEQEPEALLQALMPGGLLVLDDLTPENLWTEEQRRQWPIDPVRNFWLNDLRVTATEILMISNSAVILATKLR